MKKFLKILGLISVILITPILLLVLFLIFDYPTPYALGEKQNRAFAIQNVTVIDVETGKAVPNQVVIIKDSLIHQITDVEGASLATDLIKVDGTGKFLIPGMWDMHVHASFTFTPTANYSMYLANGITGVREMAHKFGPMAATLEERKGWNKAVRLGELAGPSIVSMASHIVNGPKSRVEGMPDFLGPENAEQGRQLVHYLKEQGFDFIKSYNLLNRETYFAMAAEAEKVGLPLAGHRPLAVSAVETAQAGQKSLEHARLFLQESNPKANEFRNGVYTIQDKRYMVDSFDIDIFSEICSIFIVNDVYLCPTHVTREFDAGIYDTAFLESPLLRYIPAIQKNFWLSDATSEREEAGEGEGKDILNDFYRKGVEITGLAHENGVKILVGTDATDSYVFPGFSYHRELEHLKEAGMSEHEILKAATITAATYEGQQESFGTVKVGKYADLVLLNRNPLNNIQYCRDIHAVFLNGYHYDRTALDAMLEQTEKNVSSSFFKFLEFIIRFMGGGDDFTPNHDH